MKKLAFLILFVSVLLVGCANKTYLPSGAEGYVIYCGGSLYNWGVCYEKAGKICKEKGYNVISKTGDTNAQISSNQYGLYGSSSQTRELMIECKK